MIEHNEVRSRFLELYAEPTVTANYMRLAVLILSAVALLLAVLLFHAEKARANLKPLVISISDAGRGQVMNYDEFSKIPFDRVGKYYLARWAELYYARNHSTLERDFSESLDFFSTELQSGTLARIKKARTLESFLLDPGASNIDVEIRAVILEDTRQAPYRAHIEFDKIYRNTADPEPQRRERWTANVVYGFRDQVPNQMLLTNPLGLVISYVREDQAFEN